jgi:hypothetical protein
LDASKAAVFRPAIRGARIDLVGSGVTPPGGIDDGPQDCRCLAVEDEFEYIDGGGVEHHACSDERYERDDSLVESEGFTQSVDAETHRCTCQHRKSDDTEEAAEVPIDRFHRERRGERARERGRQFDAESRQSSFHVPFADLVDELVWRRWHGQ